MLTGLRRARASRSATRAAVRRRADLLRPGPWVAAGEALWRHRSAAVPEHLHRTKARGSDWRALVREAALPRRFRVPGPGGRGGYPLAVATYDGAVVLLDPAGGRVARTLPPDVDVAGYRDRRTRFGAHLGTPAFTIEPGLLTEAYVAGGHVLELAPRAQVTVLADLLARCAALTAAEGSGSAEADVRAVTAHVATAELPADLRRHLTRLPLAELAAGWPLVPAATDATVRNLVVVDGRAVPIDLGDLAPAAFFEYPLGMVANARPHGLAAYLAGDLDREVDALFAAAGASWPLDDEGRVTLLAVRIALATLARSGRGPEATERFAEGAARRWRNLWGADPAR